MKTRRELYRDIIIVVIVMLVCYGLTAVLVMSIINDPNWLSIP